MESRQVVCLDPLYAIKQIITKCLFFFNLLFLLLITEKLTGWSQDIKHCFDL